MIYETPDDIRGEAREALVDLLYRLADDDLIVGHRNSEWTGLAPILEADIAFSSIAQDQMGQASAYYSMLHDVGEPDPDTNAFLRDPADFRCASIAALDRGDWAFSTVRLYLYEVAKSIRIAALGDSSYRPLANLTRKMRGEQKYHLMHAEMWIKKLGGATDDSRRLMQRALDELYPHALGIFEPTPKDDAIYSAGIAPREADLCREWTGKVRPFLTDAGLVVPDDVEPIYGGRQGRHPPELAALLEAMQKVYRLDPTASW
jgi:ring-1,2-phenylacetyl-CoA epoxidase subunit PaaC